MRCAVIMPDRWRGGMLNMGILLSRIISGIEIDGAPVSVSFCIPSDYDESLVTDLPPEVNIVKFDAVPWGADNFTRYNFIDWEDAPPSPTYTNLEAKEGAMDIVMADVWVLMTARFAYGPLLPLKPMVIYAPDFIQRVVPEIYGDNPVSVLWKINGWQALTLQRSASVFATSKKTASDAVTYCGVSPEKVHVLPMVHSPLFKEVTTPRSMLERKAAILRRQDRPKFPAVPPDAEVKEAFGASVADEILESGAPYILWVTNTTAHKNHTRALKALELYYEEYDGRFPCVMCGAQTAGFLDENSVPTIMSAHKLIAKSGPLRGRFAIAGEVSSAKYRDSLQAAAFLWHNVLYDNGTFSVIEAARLGTRALVSAYPQMLEIVDHFEINAATFDPWDIGATAKALKMMEHDVAATPAAKSAYPDERDSLAFRKGLAALFVDAAGQR